ncbi:MAG TPA: hypothetical protein VHN74_11990 [Candidatus Angelobacter sp.]|jgi:hypothetical protein|nr:hypothetical protein [Candidatus Angelobacter sp.]
MKTRIQIAVATVLLLVGVAQSQNRDATSRDLRGVPHSHKYFWSVFGGTVLGTGIGIIAPGGNTSAVKGAILGGSITSAFYLASHRRAAGNYRPWAHIATNAAIVGGGLWTICDCGSWGWAGALIGGGGTAVLQSFGRGNRHLTASNTGDIDQSSTTAEAIPELTPWSPAVHGKQDQSTSREMELARKALAKPEHKPEHNQQEEQQ